MARIPGRNGVFIFDPAGDGVLQVTPFISKYTIPRTVAMFDVTAMGDLNHVYVADLPDSKGTYAGFFDDATAQMYTAAGDGNPRKLYIYAKALSGGAHNYWFTTAIMDTTINGGSGQSVDISGNWAAASNVIYVQ